MREIEIGNTVLVEQAWEDILGIYHDEYAIVTGIDGENVSLIFLDVTGELAEFLNNAEFTIDDLSES